MLLLERSQYIRRAYVHVYKYYFGTPTPKYYYVTSFFLNQKSVLRFRHSTHGDCCVCSEAGSTAKVFFARANALITARTPQVLQQTADTKYFKFCSRA